MFHGIPDGKPIINCVVNCETRDIALALQLRKQISFARLNGSLLLVFLMSEYDIKRESKGELINMIQCSRPVRLYNALCVYRPALIPFTSGFGLDSKTAGYFVSCKMFVKVLSGIANLIKYK
eukprot:sb/3476026/